MTLDNPDIFNFNLTRSCLHCSKCIKCDLWHDPIYALLAAVMGGILFAGFSWGFVYFLIFLFIWEILYWIYTGYDDTKIWSPQIRVGLVLGALFGFIVGRTFHNCDDFRKDYNDFWDFIDECYAEK